MKSASQQKLKSLKDKKGQVGETVSWVVATIIIVAILLIFIWISILMAKAKNFSTGDVQTDSGTKVDLLAQKTAMANQLDNNQNKEMIDNILKENG